MGNSSSSCVHLALLGDSSIDNGAWTGGGPSVFEQVKTLLPQTTLCAKDGALISAIAHQATRAPANTTHYVVSVGGNDCMSGVNVMRQAASTVADGVEALSAFAVTFEKEYSEAIESLVREVGPHKHIVLCSMYSPCFGPMGVTSLSQMAADVCIALLADAIVRVATRLRLPVIDWRRVMTEVQDFANPIEPSSLGGQKMARVLVDVVLKHPFRSAVSSSPLLCVYPQRYPPSELTSQPLPALIPRDPRHEDTVCTSRRPGEKIDQQSGQQESTPDAFLGALQRQQKPQQQQSGPRVHNVLEDPAAAAVVQNLRSGASSLPVKTYQPRLTGIVTPGVHHLAKV